MLQEDEESMSMLGRIRVDGEKIAVVKMRLDVREHQDDLPGLTLGPGERNLPV